MQEEAKPGAPFGEKCAEMLTETLAMYERHGFFGKVNQEGGYTISYYGDDNPKTIGLFSHGDVVPADGEWLICPPFEPIIKNGYVFGRGCNDDKSGILQSIYAAEIIRELGFDLKSRLLMFTGVNEKTGMKDIEAFVKHEPMPDASIVADGEYPCYCGERGTLRFKLISKKKFDTIRKICGGKAANTILDEVVAEISYNEVLWKQIESACKDNDKFKISNDGDTITVVAKGISAHMMHAENSLNAGKVLADMLLSCNSLGSNDIEILKDISTFLNDAYGTGFGIAHNDAVFGRLVCGNGIIRTTTDGCPDLFFDVRAGLSYELDTLRSRVQSVVGDAWNYIEDRYAEGYYMPEDNKLRMLVEKTYAKVSGITDSKSICTAGGTHAKKLKNAVSIGTVGYHKAQPIKLPKGHGGVHQPDEMLNIAGFLEAIKILVCMIMELDAALNE